MANVFIALPTYGGQIFANCANSVLHLTHVLREQGHQWHVGWTLSESLVQRARNTLVHAFMKTECSHLLFIDADIIFKADDVLGMLAADKELVAGAYPKKGLNVEQIAAAVVRNEKDPLAFAANYAINVDHKRFPVDENNDVTLTPDKGCIPVLDLPTGFMLAKRSAFVDMAAALPEIEYVSDEASTKGEPMFAWFDCAIEDGRYLSEDYLFSRRVQRMGHEAWLYLPAVLGHIGTHVYRGDLTKTFRPQTQPDVDSQKEWGFSESSLPEENDPRYAKRMIARYEWAAKRIKGQRVADAACGPGYGVKLLTEAGKHVFGYDRSEDNFNKARSIGVGINVTDLESHAPYRFDTIDALVSIETLEHLRKPIEWLRGVHSNVKELVLSCPCVPTKHINRWHLHDFTYDEVLGIVRGIGWTVQEHEHEGDDTIILYATRE